MLKLKILVLAAHPDDETIGCGATIAKYNFEKKADTFLITFTDGVGARNLNQKNRNLKLKKVSKILGIKKFKFGSFPDNQMDSIPLLEICRFIEKNVTYQPDIIFTHHQDCLNIDHSIVSRAALTVFRPQSTFSPEINCFRISSSTEYNPLNSFKGNLYVDVKKYYKKKLAAMKIYSSELRKYPHPRNIKSILNTLKSDGSEVGLEFAEKFQTIRRVK